MLPITETIVGELRTANVMPIIAGGIIEGWGAPKDALLSVIREVGKFSPRQSVNDYVIDIAFRLWDPGKQPEFAGVRPGMVGRKQRRFIIWHSYVRRPTVYGTEPQLAGAPRRQGVRFSYT